MPQAKAYSVASATAPFVSESIPRHEPTDTDIAIEILYCGICHSDLREINHAVARIPIRGDRY